MFSARYSRYTLYILLYICTCASHASIPRISWNIGQSEKKKKKEEWKKKKKKEKKKMTFSIFHLFFFFFFFNFKPSLIRTPTTNTTRGTQLSYSTYSTLCSYKTIFSTSPCKPPVTPCMHIHSYLALCRVPKVFFFFLRSSRPRNRVTDVFLVLVGLRELNIYIYNIRYECRKY